VLDFSDTSFADFFASELKGIDRDGVTIGGIAERSL
jgi:hypothetical protein